MRCPECQHPNVPGSLFCELCGADLQAEPASAPAQSGAAAPAPDAPPAGLVCAHCGHGNQPDYRICEACGRPLAPLSAVETPDDEVPARRLETGQTPPPPPPPPSSTPPGSTPGQLATGPQRGKVKLIVEQGMVLGKQFLLAEEQSLVGREDAGDRIYPEIDLSGLDEGYVHRRHALLTFEGSFLFVTHLGGHNRTYVNNRPIADNLPYPLNIGDTVRFGKVLLRVTEA